MKPNISLSSPRDLQTCVRSPSIENKRVPYHPLHLAWSMMTFCDQVMLDASCNFKLPRM